MRFNQHSPSLKHIFKNIIKDIADRASSQHKSLDQVCLLRNMLKVLKVQRCDFDWASRPSTPGLISHAP